MKRLFISLSLIVILAVSITACGKKTNTKPPQIKNTKTNNSTSNINTNTSTSSTDVTNTTNSNNANNNSVNENQAGQNQIYYGDWTIKKLLAYGPVGELSNNDIKKMIGEKISFSNQRAVYQGNICQNPAYKKTTISGSDFESNNKVSLSRLAVTSNSIDQVVVYTDNNFKNTWDSTGSTFYIKDQNTLILFVGGVYLELDRLNN
jgi:predicted small lipoprotein YifL